MNKLSHGLNIAWTKYKMGKIKMIEGVVVTPLKQIFHPKGDIFHGMKRSDYGYTNFGEAYFSTVLKSVVKPWKKHLKMTLNIMVPEGEIQFVIYDDRQASSTHGEYFTISLSPKNYCRLTIPPNVWVAFKGIGSNKNMLLNIADMEHDHEEILRLGLDQISYSW